MSALPSPLGPWRPSGPRRWCPYCQDGVPFARTHPPAHVNLVGVSKRASPNSWLRCWWISPRPGDKKRRAEIRRSA